MRYDFESTLDRSGTHAVAIDGVGSIPGFAPTAPKEGFDLIPMWVADMNFAVPPSITDAIIQRARHPAFGYFITPDAYYDAIISWHARRKGVRDLTKGQIGYENGVLGGVASAIAAFSAPGDKILLHSPTYIGFTETVGNMGRTIVHSPLVRDEAGVWRMDFDDMERKLEEGHIHLAVFCSPHNPCGRVWERWELERAMEVFERHQCLVIADEIWSDLVLDGTHIPTQQVGEWAHEHVIALYAPSKTFNLAGLVGSYHVIYSPYLRDRMGRVSAATHYNDMNVLSMEALLGAYSEGGEEWLEQLLPVLRRNRDYACDFIERRLEGVETFRAQGTYMLFIDCAGWLAAHGKTLRELEQACWDVGVAVQDGAMFGGPTHLRMNLALPTSRVKEAFRRLDEYVF